MKTGTPVRIDKRSVHFEDMEIQPGDSDFHQFSYMGEHRVLKQLPCWTCYTNNKVHETLKSGLADSPLYNGQIQSTGPRYCPSIETKLVTFPDKDQHPLFLEPEGEDTNEMYLNGFSSSMPMDIQLKALHEIPALRDAKIYRPGYAIEYDYFDPTQLKHSLESKIIKGLFFAGQVNGTTGYEEAGGQGTVAGINAALYCTGSKTFEMQRDESYIGVLIDDLTTKGVDEPYRMFTSRAEYRILLRQDDADARLTEKAYELGIAKRDRFEWWMQKKEQIDRIIEFCANYPIKKEMVNSKLEALGTTPLRAGCKLIDLVARPHLNLQNLAEIIPDLKEVINAPANRKEEITEVAPELEVGESITLKNVFFQTGKYTLLDISIVELDKVVEMMQHHPTLRIELGGHTDNVGNAAANQKLSEQRAKAVYDYLVQHGIDASRLSYKGYGQTQPVADNSTADGRRQNRRTVFTIIEK